MSQTETQGYFSWIADWIYSYVNQLLRLLNLSDRKATIVILGLDFAGKTTLLYLMKGDGQILRSPLPTNHPTKEEWTLGNIKFAAWDLGGHENGRALWEKYYVQADAILYVVDAADRDRLAISKAEFDKLLLSESIADVPIVVLGNKVDLPKAATEEELRKIFGLQFTTGKNVRSWSAVSGRPLEVFMCAIGRKTGFVEPFQWLSNFLP